MLAGLVLQTGAGKARTTQGGGWHGGLGPASADIGSRERGRWRVLTALAVYCTAF